MSFKRKAKDVLSFIGIGLVVIIVAWGIYEYQCYSYERYQRKYPNTTYLDWLTDRGH